MAASIRSRSSSLSSLPQSLPQSRFSCRIVDIDSYVTSPLRNLDVTYSDFAGEVIKKVPVIRVFGATPTGQKCCLHIHGIFPYLYVPCLADNPTEKYLHQFGRSIDHALQVSLGAGSKDENHVFKISVVKGIPFYGYHPSEQVFLKIYLYNPTMIKRLADLLLSGAIMNISLQPHESHIPFVLQFMIDYSLYGMNYIHSSDVKFRLGGDDSFIVPTSSDHQTSLSISSPLHSPVSSLSSSSSHGFINPSQQFWDVTSLSNDMLIHETRTSTCELEADILSTDILNREELNIVSGGYPGLQALREEEQRRRESLGLDSSLSPPLSPERCWSLVHNAEEKHQIYLQNIIRERRSLSPSPSQHANLLNKLSQSCEPELHQSSQPHDLEKTPSIESPNNVKVPSVVNEELIQHSIRLQQKLSSVSLNSSDAELFDILMELAQSSQTPSSLSSQTGGENLSSKIKRTTSTTSSLLSDSSGHIGPTELTYTKKVTEKSISPCGSDVDLFEDEEPKMGGFKLDLKPDFSPFGYDEDSSSKSPPQDEIITPTKQCGIIEGFFAESQIPSNQAVKKDLIDSSNILQEDLTQRPELNISSMSGGLSCQERRQVIQLCLSYQEEGVEVEGEERETGEELGDEEEESQIMSQAFWEEEEKMDSERTMIDLSLESIDKPHPEVEFIPQFDGANDVKKKKSLGLSRHRPPKQSHLEISPSKQIEIKVNPPNYNPKPDLSSSPVSTLGKKRRKRPSLSLQKKKYVKKELPSKNTSLPTTSEESSDFIPQSGSQSREATPKIHSPMSDVSIVERALTQSLFPIVKKLSREESEKYLNVMRRSTSVTSDHPSLPSPNDHKRLGASLCLLESKRPCTRSSNHVNITDLSEDDVISIAITESLKTFEEEIKQKQYDERGLEENTDKEMDSTLVPVLEEDFANTEFQLVMSASDTESNVSSQGRQDYEMTSTPAPVAKQQETIHWRLKENEILSEEKETLFHDKSLKLIPSDCIIQPKLAPPTAEDLLKTAVNKYNLPLVRHCKPFYSKPADVQPPQDIGGCTLYVPSQMPYELPEFSPLCEEPSSSWFSLRHWATVLSIIKSPIGGTQVTLPPSCHGDGTKGVYTANDHQRDVKIRSQFWPKGPCIITPAKCAPNPSEITLQIQNLSIMEMSALEGPSLNNTYGFQFTPTTTTDITTNLEVQFITCMSVEVHVRTREKLKPDPEWDPVLVLFYYIHNDWPNKNGCGSNARLGAIVVDLNNSKNVTTPTKHKSPVKKSPKKMTTKPSPQKALASKIQPDSPAKTLLGNSAKNGHIANIQNAIDSDLQRPYLEHCGISGDLEIAYVQKESELFEQLIKLVRQVDPDILVGYEVQMASWGYLKTRAAYLGLNLIGQIARVPTVTSKQAPPIPKSVYEGHHVSELHVQGRVVLNVWRVMRHEISLTSYSFENVTYHVLHQRVPAFSYQALTEWYDHVNRLYRHRVVDYYVTRCRGNYQLLEKFNLIGRTSELARLYGIEFYNVLARGSQYRVESMMLRLAKPANYIAVSPSVQQRARMSAPECIPLVMEPESKFYSDPVLVLDFQSLYPSMVIGYNYCFSTCLGRVKNLATEGDYTFGTCSLNSSSHLLQQLENDVTISPNGIVFVKPHIRRGILPKMLEEILNTRIMVKQSMKLHKGNKILQRILDARQLGLKLIANVTYGYTAASYSGRMPCVEIADSIVRKGRETLERAIQLVNSTPEWRARVVYGDTDSMFVLVKGVSKEEAFRIGQEISERVTADNPKPIKLKFEKVYLPCILQTKKRYVGFMYESLDQKEPVYDAKGIETVRRDGCPAVVKILEKSLHLLFSTRDMSIVKSYVQRQCRKILDGRVSLQDYILAKEYRGRNGYRPGACVPALELAKQSTAVDRRSEPRVSERVPYVIVYGSPGLPLIKLVRRPEDVLSNPSLRLNGIYYITKQILPALDRALSILGVNVYPWYTELPRIQRPTTAFISDETGSKKGTIGQYFTSLHCPICEKLTTDNICNDCSKNPHLISITLSSRIQQAEHRYIHLSQLCQNCCGNTDNSYYLECRSLDCPVLYSRQTSLYQLKLAENFQRTLNNFVSSLSN